MTALIPGGIAEAERLAGRPLTECPYSIALDYGIPPRDADLLRDAHYLDIADEGHLAIGGPAGMTEE